MKQKMLYPSKVNDTGLNGKPCNFTYKGFCWFFWSSGFQFAFMTSKSNVERVLS